MPWVRIKKGAHHHTVEGTEVSGGDVVEVSEAEMVSFGDKFDLPADESILKVLATKAAKEYAEEHCISLSLSAIQGTGKDGRITLADVKAALQVGEHGDT